MPKLVGKELKYRYQSPFHIEIILVRLLAKSYDVRQIRDFLLAHNFNEIISVEASRRYFIKEHYVVKLILSESRSSKQIVDRLQVELICQNIMFPFHLFEQWYRKAKKHKV